MRKRVAVSALAGWLFADSMLGLMIVGLAAEPGHATPKPRPVVHPSPSATAKRTPVVRAKPKPPAKALPSGVEQHAVVKMFTLKTGTADAVLKKQIRASYAGLLHDHRRAAFVLTFGTSTQPGEGVTLARRTNAALARDAPEIFAGSARRDFWQSLSKDAPTPQTVRVEVYLFTAGTK